MKAKVKKVVYALTMKHTHLFRLVFIFIFFVGVLEASVALAGPIVSVSYNPQPVQFSHTGSVNGTQGSRQVNVNVSRRETGDFCAKVGWIHVYVDVPNSHSLNDHTAFSKPLGRGLCSFDETVTGELVTSNQADQACGGGGLSTGKIKTLDHAVMVKLWFNNGNEQIIDQRTLQAKVKCACTRVGFDSYGILPNPVVYTGNNNNVRLIRAYGQGVLKKQVSGALPQGMTLDLDQGSNVYLNGQPTIERDYTFTVDITDSCPYGSQSAQKTFTVPVRCGKFEFPATLQLLPASVGVPYSYQLETTCSRTYTPQKFSGGNLPPGLTISTTGLLSGTPTATGNFNVTVRSEQTTGWSSGPASKTIPMKVSDTKPPVLTSLTVTPMCMKYEAGQAMVVVKASENYGVAAVNVLLSSQGGQQTSTKAVLVSGSATNGEWRASLTVPANKGNKPLTYTVKAVISDASYNFITSQPVNITVWERFATTTTTQQCVQGQASGRSNVPRR